MKHPKLKTTKQRILYTLYVGRQKNGKFNLAPYNHDGAWISGGWLPLYALRGPMLGGDSAGRRVRELRESGWPVVDKDHSFVVGGVKRNMHIYALGVDPGTLNWDWDRIIEGWPSYRPLFDQFREDEAVSETDLASEPAMRPVEAITQDIRELFHAHEAPTLEHVKGILDRHLQGIAGDL